VEGIVFVISGPAGVGKTTLCDRLLSEFPSSLRRVVTATTRKPRLGEVDGVDYHFLSKEDFLGQVNEGAFVEYELVHQNLYGTQKNAILVEHGNTRQRDLLLNIDVNGTSSLKKFAEDNTFLRGAVFSVFVLPSSIHELRDRLIQRGSDNQAEIETRLKTAEREIARKDQFDFVLSSKGREADYQRLKDYYLSRSNNPKDERKG
jgi:guanylate kinase